MQCNYEFAVADAIHKNMGVCIVLTALKKLN